MQTLGRTMSTPHSSTTQPAQGYGRPDVANQLNRFARNCCPRCPSFHELRQAGQQAVSYVVPHYYLICGLGFTALGIAAGINGNRAESAACLLTASGALYSWTHPD